MPLMVITKLEPPAIVTVGLILVVEGIGLLTVKVRELEVPPPGVGLKTVMLAVVPEAMSVARICAVS